MTDDPGATWAGMLALMRGDFERTVHECTMGKPVGRLRKAAHLAVPSALCALIFRLAHYLHANGWVRSSAVVTLCNRRLCGVMLHPGSQAGPGLFIPHPTGVTFCGRAGDRLTIYPMGHISPARFPGWRQPAGQQWPVLGDDVRIGTFAVVSGAVSVGHGATVGVQVTLRTDFGAGLAASVRPNWRTRPANTPDRRVEPQS